jgi:hypothetical protein
MDDNQQVAKRPVRVPRGDDVPAIWCECRIRQPLRFGKKLRLGAIEGHGEQRVISVVLRD